VRWTAYCRAGYGFKAMQFQLAECVGYRLLQAFPHIALARVGFQCVVAQIRRQESARTISLIVITPASVSVCVTTTKKLSRLSARNRSGNCESVPGWLAVQQALVQAAAVLDGIEEFLLAQQRRRSSSMRIGFDLLLIDMLCLGAAYPSCR